MPEIARLADHRGDTAGLGRMPPCNPEAERALLGAIMLNNKSFDKVSDFLQPEHFGDSVNARIYMACQRVISAGGQANAVTLKTHLERDELVISAGGIKYLAALGGGVITTVNVAEYGKLIVDLYTRRQLIDMATEILERAYESHLDDGAEKQLGSASEMIAGLISTEGRKTSVTIAEAVQESLKAWEDHDKGVIDGISTGLVSLDDELGLLRGGDLIVLAGASSQGKTALAMTMAFNAARKFLADAVSTKPKRAVVFSAEMPHRELSDRAITTFTGVAGPRRRKQALSEIEWQRINAWQSEINDLPLIIDDRRAPSIGYVQSRLRQISHQAEIGLVVIDFLHLMGEDEQRRNDNRVEQLGRLINGAKSVALQFKAPTIMLSALNREFEKRDNKRPIRSDLKGAGDIEYAADVIAFVHREEYYLEREQPALGHKDRGAWEMKMDRARNIAEVIVDKARNGSSGGVARLNFERSRTLFSDIPPDDDGDPMMQGRFL